MEGEDNNFETLGAGITYEFHQANQNWVNIIL